MPFQIKDQRSRDVPEHLTMPNHFNIGNVLILVLFLTKLINIAGSRRRVYFNSNIQLKY